MQQSTAKDKAELRGDICSKCGKPLGFSNANVLTGWILKPAVCQCPAQETETRTEERSPATIRAVPGESSPFPNLGSRFEILERIGQGGMGFVYKAKDNAIDSIVAIKVLQPELVQDQAALKRFEQEAESAKQLSHPHLVSVFDHGTTDDGAPYIVMAYLDGVSLDELLKECGHLESKRAVKITRDVCDALAYAHKQGVIHRDIKPTNIIITNVGSSDEQAHIVDFGIAKVLPTANRETHDLTQTGEIFGSPHYMSPEQCLGFMLDTRSDIYSVGCLMYELFTGAAPFEGANPIQLVVKHINEDPAPFPKAAKVDKQVEKLENVTLHCLSKDKNDRYQSAEDVLVDLNAIVNGKPVTKYLTVTKAKPTLTRKQTIGIIVMFLGLTIYGAILVATFNNDILGKVLGCVLTVVCFSGTYVFLSSARDIYRKRLKVLTEPNAWCIALLGFLGIACLTIGLGLGLHNMGRSVGQLVFINNVVHLGSLFGAIVSAVGWGLFRKGGSLRPARLAAKFACIAMGLSLFLCFGIPSITCKLITAFANTCYENHQPLASRGLFQLATVLEPKNVESLNHLADVEQSLRLYKDAAVTRSKAVDLMKPGQEYLLLNRAQVYEFTQEFDKELKDLDLALKLNPRFHLGYQRRSAYYENRGMLDIAADDKEKEIKFIDHPDPFSLEKLVSLQCRLGRFKEAIDAQSLVAVLKDDSNMVNNLTLLGMLYDQVGSRNTEAVAAYKEALRLCDTSEGRAYGLAQAYAATRLGKDPVSYLGHKPNDTEKAQFLKDLAVEGAPFTLHW